MSRSNELTGTRIFDCLLCKYGGVQGDTPEDIKIKCKFKNKSSLFITEYDPDEDIFKVRCLKYMKDNNKVYKQGDVIVSIPSRTLLFTMKELSERIGMSYSRLRSLYGAGLLPEPAYSVKTAKGNVRRLFTLEEMESIKSDVIYLKENINVNKAIREMRMMEEEVSNSEKEENTLESAPASESEPTKVEETKTEVVLEDISTE